MNRGDPSGAAHNQLLAERDFGRGFVRSRVKHAQRARTFETSWSWNLCIERDS